MAREEKYLYNPGGVDDDGHSGEKPEEAEDIEELESGDGSLTHLLMRTGRDFL